MPQRTKKPGASKIRSAAFQRIRADHSSELAEDYVELIADLINEKGEARGSDVAMRLGVANATADLRHGELVTLDTREGVVHRGARNHTMASR